MVDETKKEAVKETSKETAVKETAKETAEKVNPIAKEAIAKKADPNPSKIDASKKEVAERKAIEIGRAHV